MDSQNHVYIRKGYPLWLPQFGDAASNHYLTSKIPPLRSKWNLPVGTDICHLNLSPQEEQQIQFHVFALL